MARFDRAGCSRDQRCLAHYGNRLPSQHELTDLDIDPVHARKEEIVSATGIDDQESAKRPERSSKGNPSIRW